MDRSGKGKYDQNSSKLGWASRMLIICQKMCKIAASFRQFRSCFFQKKHKHIYKTGNFETILRLAKSSEKAWFYIFEKNDTRNENL